MKGRQDRKTIIRKPVRAGGIYNFKKEEECSPAFVIPSFSTIVHKKGQKGKKNSGIGGKSVAVRISINQLYYTESNPCLLSIGLYLI